MKSPEDLLPSYYVIIYLSFAYTRAELEGKGVCQNRGGLSHMTGVRTISRKTRQRKKPVTYLEMELL